MNRNRQQREQMDGNTDNQVFQRFRPICVKLMQEHTLENVMALQKLLEVPTDPAVLQQLQEYILFPLRLIQKQSPNKCENFRTEVIKCQIRVLNQTEVTRFEVFQDIFTAICISLSSTNPENKVAPLCEELKLALVQCLSALMNSSTSTVLEEIYKAKFLPPLGHAISLLLHLVETERMRQLRLASITCIQDLAILNRKGTSRLLILAADTFASFLPGISMAMTKVATGDPKQGHLVTKTAIETWTGIVCLVLGDKNMSTQSKMTQKETAEDESYQKLIVIRNAEWIKNTTEKLKILITRMIPVANHSNWRVRLAMVEWADRLLTNCTESLESCVPDLLDVLVSRVGDEYEKVSSASRQALATFQNVNLARSRTLVEILENNLHNLATNLPRLIRTSDDDAKFAHLSLFNGYLQLLGPHVRSLLKSHTHFQHLSAALLQVLELDCTGLNIIQEKTPAVLQHRLGGRHDEGWLKKTFKHFTDHRIENELIRLCHLIGYYGELDLVVDHFLERFMQSSTNRKQAAYILNEILLGCCGQKLTVDVPTVCEKGLEELCHSIRMIIDEYLQPEHWNLITSNQSNNVLSSDESHDWVIVSTNQRRVDTTGLTVEQINSNILQLCLLLEGIATFSKVLGTDYQPLLMDVLYPVLEKIADDNNSVSQTAYTALCCMSEACKYSNIQELILANADYLVNSISLRLRHLVSNPKAPLVLKVTVTYSKKEILPIIDDTITEIFDTLDNHYGDRAFLFVQVLHALVLSIIQWFPMETKASSNQQAGIVDELKKSVQEHSAEADTETRTKHSLQEIGEYFMDYLRQKQIAEELDAEETEVNIKENNVPNNRMEDLEKDTDVKQLPPKHVVIVKQIMERCVHLLASPDARLRLLVLDTVAQCSVALQQHEDELLPLIHKVWPPFVLRFTDEEKLVIIKAFQVLRVLADTSGDFIRQRVVKDVLPKTTDWLHKLASASKKAGPAYRFTTACRLQLSILEHLGSLCSEVHLAAHQLGPVLEAALPYLSAKQHPALQEAAVEAWLSFGRHHPDYVWLLFCNIYLPQPLTAPDQRFKAVNVNGSQKRNEFSDNIEKILSVVE